MATGELSSGETARQNVRQALVDKDYVDCVVSLPGQLFANTQIPCCLWFLSKNRDGQRNYRQRNGEILFIDARKMGALIPGSRKQKQLSEAELNQIAEIYQVFRRKQPPKTIAGFCKVATISDIQAHDTKDGGQGMPAPDLKTEALPIFLDSLEIVRQLLPPDLDYGTWRQLSNLALTRLDTPPS